VFVCHTRGYKNKEMCTKHRKYYLEVKKSMELVTGKEEIEA
jgi:hypothetical protein